MKKFLKSKGFLVAALSISCIAILAVCWFVGRDTKTAFLPDEPSEYACMMVADATGVSYENMLAWQYKILLEPIAYVTFNGTKYAFTATEAALYDQLSGGSLRSKLPTVAFQNLPLVQFFQYWSLAFWTAVSLNGYPAACFCQLLPAFLFLMLILCTCLSKFLLRSFLAP